jgi:hypothetical protein
MAAHTIEFPRLLWYQEPVVKSLEDSVCKYVTFLASRRIGKSLIAKCMAVRWCLSEKCNVGFLVPTGDLARKFIREINDNLSGSGAIIASNSVDKFIAFANGSLLYFHSAEAWARGAGNYKYLIVDECAFIENEIWDSIFKPWTLEAKKVYFCSTPCGIGGVFYDMYHKGNQGGKRYVSYECNLEDSGLYDEETIKDIKETTPSRIYEQEYNCKFLAGGISCFPNFEERLTETPGERTKRLYAGIDFSGANGGTDSTVLTIVNERFETVGVYTYPYGDSRTLEEMAHTMKTLNVTHCYAEENAMGAISIEMIKNIYKPITGFTTTNESKRNIVEHVIRNFETGKGSILQTPESKLQFGNFIMDYTKGGKITYHNLKDTIHDDLVISYCLASWCAKQMNRKGKYTIS